MRSLRALLAVGFALTGTVAFGADAVFPESAPTTLAAPPSVYTWSGPYGGAFVGYNWSDFDGPADGGIRADGFVGGVYTGFNLQNDQLVYGLEADVGGSNVDGGGFNSLTGLPSGADQGAFGSVRARLGLAYDPFLFFATGGVAVADNELGVGGAVDSNTHFGWTFGAGIEAIVTDNLRSRVEYRYSDYESRDYNVGTDLNFSSGFDEHSIRAGLALRF